MKELSASISRDTLCKILDNIRHEIYVTDANMNIMYVGQTSQKHYGLQPEEMIGKNHADFSGEYWYPSVLSLAYREKRRMCIQQMTIKGETLISTAVPVFDDDNNVVMAVSVVQEEMKSLDMSVDPGTGPEYSIWAKPDEEGKSCAVKIITRSSSMEKVLALSKKAAKSDIAVLIKGESGTGKGMLAKHIHENSSRSAYPFLSINCAAIPENLLESELFGYAPHAFTGASRKGKKGLIEMAEGGSLFLDELAELAAPLQAKLLNVVENNQYRQVGGKEVKTCNVRIISATNQPLEEAVKHGRFREDLYWRLNIMDLTIPPLASRKEDIIPLTSYYLNRYNIKYKTNKTIDQKVFSVFMDYKWPGNVRQLKNIIERAFVLSANSEITISDLPSIMLQATEAEKQKKQDFQGRIDELERQLIRKLAAKYNSSRKLASVLNIGQTKANRLLQKHLHSS